VTAIDASFNNGELVAFLGDEQVLLRPTLGEVIADLVEGRSDVAIYDLPNIKLALARHPARLPALGRPPLRGRRSGPRPAESVRRAGSDLRETRPGRPAHVVARPAKVNLAERRIGCRGEGRERLGEAR
jgi:hypothetical protein